MPSQTRISRRRLVLAWTITGVITAALAALLVLSILIKILDSGAAQVDSVLLLVTIVILALALVAFLSSAVYLLLRLNGRQTGPLHRGRAALVVSSGSTSVGGVLALVVFGLQPSFDSDSQNEAILATLRDIGFVLASLALISTTCFCAIVIQAQSKKTDDRTTTEIVTSYTSEMKNSPSTKEEIHQPRSPRSPTAPRSDMAVIPPKRAGTGQIFVKPMNSKTRLISHASVQSMATTNSVQTASTRAEDGFDTWEVNVDHHPGETELPRPFVVTRLEPIPASRPVSPAKQLERALTESPQRQATPELLCPEPDDDNEITPRATRVAVDASVADSQSRRASADTVETISPIDRTELITPTDSVVSPVEDNDAEATPTKASLANTSDAKPNVVMRYPPPAWPIASFHLPRPMYSSSGLSSGLPSPALSTASAHSSLFSTPLQTPSLMQSPTLHHSQSLVTLNDDQSHIHPLFRTTSVNKQPIPKVTSVNTVVHASPWGGQTISTDDQNALGLSLAPPHLPFSRPVSPDVWPLSPNLDSPPLPTTSSTVHLPSLLNNAETRPPVLRSHRSTSSALRQRPPPLPILARRDPNIRIGSPRSESTAKRDVSVLVGLGITTVSPVITAQNDQAGETATRPTLRAVKSAADISPERANAAAATLPMRRAGMQMPKANMPPPPSPAYFTPSGMDSRDGFF